MAQIINVNGKEYALPDNLTPEQVEAERKSIEQSLSGKNLEVVRPEENEEDKRGILTDVPVQIIGGIRDMANSTLKLGEPVGQWLKQKTNIGGFTFGENARNGIMQFHTYEDAVKNGIKMPLTGDITKVGDIKELPEVSQPDTKTGALTRGISQFVSGWYVTKPLKGINAVNKFSQASKVGAFTVASGRGAVADFVAFDEDTGRFADMINDTFPALQNPLLDYLASEGKDETWYEARLKNVLEGLLLGSATEGILRGVSAVDFKNKFLTTAQWIKTKRAQLAGEKASIEKLAELEKSLTREIELPTPQGKDSTKKFVNKILDEAGSQKIADTAEVIMERATAEGLNEKIVENFQNFIKKASDKEQGLDFKSIDENLDFKLSPRAYADTDFGIIVLDAVQRSIRDAKQIDVLSPKIIEQQAEKLGGDVIQNTKMLGQLGDRLQAGLKFMYFAQSAQQNIADSLYKMANAIKQGSTEYSEKDFRIATALLMKLTQFDSKVATNLGRGLGLRAVLKDGYVDLGSKEIINLVKGMEKWDGNIKDVIDAVATVKDKNMITRTLSFIFNNKFWNGVNELWMSSALSVPKTQLINLVSTGLNAYVKPLQQWMGSKLTWGLDDLTRTKLKREGAEAVATIAGYRVYLGDAIRFAKKAFNDEDSVLFAGSTKLDTNSKALGTGRIARTIRTPLRALTATDEFFKQSVYRSKLSAVAVKEAIERNLSTEKIVGKFNGKDVTEFDYYVTQRFQKGFDETGLLAVDPEVSRFAQEVTFTKDLDGTLGHIQRMVNDTPILKLILPFVKTPANLAMQAIEMTPLGIVGKNWKDFTGASRDAVKIAQVRGRFAFGTTILGMSSLLSMSGLINGGYSTDKDIRRAQIANGYVPYSFKLGGVQIEFGRLDPIGMLMGMVADYSQMYNDLNDADRLKVENNFMQFMMNQMYGGGEDNLSFDEKLSNMVIAGYKGFFKNIASKTYLRGLIDFLDAINGDDVEKRFSWWARNKFATTVIPNVFTKISNDPYLRETRNLIDELRKKVGDRSLPKTYNYLGEPVVNDSNYFWRLFNGAINPFTVGVMKEDKLLKNTIEHNLNIPAIPKVIKGIDLTQFQNDKGQTAWEYFNEEVGKSPLRKSIENLMKSNRYKNSPNEITLDENNKFGGKKALVFDKVKQYRDIVFNKIQYSSQFKSIQNPEITLGKAYINKNRFKIIGSATNKYPKSKSGIYNFIEETK